MHASLASRRLSVGAELTTNGVDFRVWAPRARRVEVVLDDGPAVALSADAEGHYGGLVEGATRGTRYRFRLDGGPPLPDPASRFQPQGPHGPSQVIDPSAFPWTDRGWRGVGLTGQVLYEMHVGTFTREGRWQAAARELAELARAGISTASPTTSVAPITSWPRSAGAFARRREGAPRC